MFEFSFYNYKITTYQIGARNVKETSTPAAEADGEAQAAAAVDDNVDDKCHELRSAGRIVYRTHLYFLPYTPGKLGLLLPYDF